MKKNTVEVPTEALRILVENAELGFAGTDDTHAVVHEAIAELQQVADIDSIWSTGSSSFVNH